MMKFAVTFPMKTVVDAIKLQTNADVLSTLRGKEDFSFINNFMANSSLY